METTEPTEITLTQEQEKTQIAEIAKASILNIAKNKEAYEALRDEYTGITLPEFKDPEFKKIYKKVTEGSGKLVKARTAADKLVKSELALLDEVKTMIKSAGEDLKAITADTEKEIKGLKETAETLIEDDKQEQLRQIEEQKQARMVELLNLGFTAKPGYYELGDLNVTQMQLIQSTTAQWEGTIAQAKVVYEAEQLRIAEEQEAEAARQLELQNEQARLKNEAEENRIANEAKQKELDEKQKAIDAQNKIIEELQAQLKAATPAPTPAVNPVPLYPINTGASKSEPTVINGHSYVTQERKEEILDEAFGPVDVLVAEEAVKGDDGIKYDQVILVFATNKPFIDTPVGKSTLRVYTEGFLDEAQIGLTPDMVAATGHISDGLLFMVIKPKA